MIRPLASLTIILLQEPPAHPFPRKRAAQEGRTGEPEIFHFAFLSLRTPLFKMSRLAVLSTFKRSLSDSSFHNLSDLAINLAFKRFDSIVFDVVPRTELAGPKARR